MKKTMMRIPLILIVALVLGLSTAVAQKKATVRGEIVELLSYVKDGMKPNSPAKKEVAMENIKNGGSLAIIEKSTNKLYVIAPSPADTAYMKNIMPYLGAKAFVKGPVYVRGSVRLILLEDIGKLLK